MKLAYRPKRGCCKSSPRCKRCPVVAKRLVKAGLAEKRADGIVLLHVSVTQIKNARKR